jgi:Subtilase family
MSFGFADEYKDIRCEIDKARAESVVVFAAVGNEGNRDELAFPARMEGSVVRVFSSNGRVKASTEFNPAPSLSSIMNFGFLGEHVQVKTAKAVDTRVDGTSIATSIAAATAALLIDFSQRKDCTGLSKREELRTVRGMSAVLAKLGMQEGNFYCFNPWSKWLDPNDQVAPDDSLKRQ